MTHELTAGRAPTRGAGVAMGLVLDDSTGELRSEVLTDILGSEDALGDMDFKVAGDEEGITAFQMDIKVEGITLAIMRNALKAAHAGRSHILVRTCRGTKTYCLYFPDGFF